jgi:hypothetical protein
MKEDVHATQVVLFFTERGQHIYTVPSAFFQESAQELKFNNDMLNMAMPMVLNFLTEVLSPRSAKVCNQYAVRKIYYVTLQYRNLVLVSGKTSDRAESSCCW